MKTLMRIALCVTSVATLSACCALNVGIDGREEFVRNRNTAVGKVLDISSVHPTMVKKKEVSSSTTAYLIGQEGYCQYEYEVLSISKVVKSWRYVSAQDKCTANRYYCGAW